MQFRLRPGERGPATQPPIWSLLLYMLLVETLNVDDSDEAKTWHCCSLKRSILARFGIEDRRGTT